MTSSRRCLSLAAVFFVCANSTAQVVPVAGGGSALASAVLAATSGSTLVVSPGTYQGFAIFDKNLVIVAPQRATIEGQITTLATGSGYLQLVGLDLIDTPSGPMPHQGSGEIRSNIDLFVEDCTCSFVYLANSTRTTMSMHDTRIDALGLCIAATNCDAVMVDCMLTSGLESVGPGTLGSYAMGFSGSTLRAERVVATGISGTFGPGPCLALTATQAGTGSFATLADCSFVPGPPSASVPAVTISSLSQATLWQCATPGGVTGTHSVAPLATAEWTSRSWTPGGSSTLTFRDAPTALATIVLSWDFERFDTPLIAEPLFVGGTPGWVLWDFGIADAQGALPKAITLPNNPALMYGSIYATAVFLSSTPWRSTASVGGLVF